MDVRFAGLVEKLVANLVAGLQRSNISKTTGNGFLAQCQQLATDNLAVSGEPVVDSLSNRRVLLVFIFTVPHIPAAAVAFDVLSCRLATVDQARGQLRVIDMA